MSQIGGPGHSQRFLAGATLGLSLITVAAMSSASPSSTVHRIALLARQGGQAGYGVAVIWDTGGSISWCNCCL